MEATTRTATATSTTPTTTSAGKTEDLGGNIDEHSRLDKGRSSIIKLDSGIARRSPTEGLLETPVDDSAARDSDTVLLGEELSASCTMHGEALSSVLPKENVNRLDSTKHNVTSLLGLLVAFGVADDSVQVNLAIVGSLNNGLEPTSIVGRDNTILLETNDDLQL